MWNGNEVILAKPPDSLSCQKCTSCISSYNPAPTWGVKAAILCHFAWSMVSKFVPETLGTSKRDTVCVSVSVVSRKAAPWTATVGKGSRQNSVTLSKRVDWFQVLSLTQCFFFFNSFQLQLHHSSTAHRLSGCLVTKRGQCQLDTSGLACSVSKWWNRAVKVFPHT